jgi:predicted nucleic acid-binding protein
VTAFLDTNIFIRFLTGDDPTKMARCLQLFQRARRGEIVLVTSESVIAEIVYVLSSRTTYRMPRADVATVLRPILTISGLRLEHKGSILGALDLWESSPLDFEDCLSVEHLRRANLSVIFSYDRHFDQIPDVTRLEP